MSKYVDTVVELARPPSLFVFDLGYCKLTAFAQSATAQAYFLSRLNHRPTLEEVVGGRGQPLDLPRSRAHVTRTRLEKTVVVGARERVAARLIAVRMPEAIVNERCRQARAVAKQRGYTPSHAYLTRLAWNLCIPKVPGTVWPSQTVCLAYALRWQVELVFKSWKRPLHLATLTKQSTRCYLYGRMLLILLTYALCPTLRATVWQKQQREVSLLKLVRHFQAGAEQWL